MKEERRGEGGLGENESQLRRVSMAEERGFHHTTKVHVSPFRNVNKKWNFQIVIHHTLQKQGPSVSVVQLHVITDVPSLIITTVILK